MSRPQTTRRGLPLLLQFALSILLGLFVAGGFYSAYLFYLTVKEVVASAQFPTIPVLYLPVPGQKPVPLTIRQETTVNWQKKERVNILLLGVDKRPEESGPMRTDTMILSTIDPSTNSASMLSVPRDLWVTIPGYGENRINMAHFDGDDKKYPGGGPALAKKTVQYNLGVPVNYYVRVDFGGFRKIVDAIGGIDIDVATPIIDDTYPDDNWGYDPVYIEAGLQHLNGDLALKYARSRHGNSDFDRAQRQQQVLMAIRDQALRLNLLPKLPELMVILAGTVQTDLQPTEILSLAQIAWKIDRSKVKSAVLGTEYTVRHITPTGADVVLPIREKIRPVVDELFNSTPVVAPEPVTVRQVVEPNQLAADGAKVSVLNGTVQKDLAAKTTAYLKQQGYVVTEPGDSGRTDYAKTVIVDYTGKTYTLGQLATQLGVPVGEIRRSPNLQSDVDIRVILGVDFHLPNS
jgi:polyisoprenyl-teichoic acid--peptidoglycan teichoic acid transferase